MPSATISVGEWGRKAVHAGMGLFALLLRWLSWPIAALCAAGALLFNLFALPAFGRGIYRDGARRRDVGIVAYPATVLLVILLFRHALPAAAAIWGMMALGDPMASIVGRTVGGPALPWNGKKTWTGSAAYAVFGAAGGALLMAFSGRVAVGVALSAFAGFALLGAFVESLETGLDDNVVPGLAVAFAWASLHMGPLVGAAGPAVVSGGPRVAFATALAVNAAIALLSIPLRLVALSGSIAGFVAGSIILHFGGWGAYAVLWTFFLFGTLASKLGYARKEKLGTAQANRARRGARHVWANVSVGAWIVFAMRARVVASSVPVLPLALAGSFAAALADTFGTELGTLYGRRPLLLSRMKAVPPGTRGAVSGAGVLGGVLGAFLVAAAGAAAGLYSWRLAVVVVAAGVAGSLAESLLIDLAARREIRVDHEFCNAFNTLVGAAVAWEIAASIALGRLYVPFGNVWGIA
ncbi:MAG TPA: DUF92 domain-containing protein [Thermoanaerobaculia bacterium]|jgi:uncharacterized protein (TIGR00297 family)|nr:DUF92 domain-containing protein [Thermoanaerobaculia bacterium]